ncbi:DUF4231 domain-containing protein [[Mycoplasma] gypis]|uniref:DUF4231 domain-containing protein n=1 Tax=[Mycoplasma] gypis TaxID=92404 RepID=A0ABZ2RMJ0_9BACT|nr:DUF4231 domain-containing protein [[Mycoplasma] gypis]MBN0919036.1 DUF4231 domain-containing protein [[Mycoplasma] gypis]
MEQETNNNKDLSVLTDYEEKHKRYRKKYVISRLIYIAISLLIMIISSLQILLNLFAIRWNEDPTLKLLFLIIAILSAIVVFIQSIMLFFDFKGDRDANMTKLRNIQNLKKQYIENPEVVNVTKLANQIYDLSKNQN